MSDWWSADPVASGQPPGPQAPVLAPAHRDLAIRTIYGEAANEPDEGQAAVAAVIKNRMQVGRYGGDSVPGVVLAKNQFEPWGNNDARARMMALRQEDPRYQKIGGIVDQIFGGQMDDPTGGATHFVAPAAQAALGRQMPSWAQGDGQAIGRHTFFAPEGRVQGAGGNWWSADPTADQPSQPAPVQHNTDGLSDRMAREGVSGPAPMPQGFADRLAAMWENPPKDKLSMIGMLKSAWEGATLPGDVAQGKVPIIGPDGRTNPEVIQRSAQLAAATPLATAPGGAFAGGSQAAAKNIASIMNPIEQAVPKAATPTIEELKAAATAGYESPAVKDLAIQGGAVRDLSATIQADLNKMGVDENLAPKTFGILGKLEKAPEGSIATGDNLNSMRRIFGNAAASPDPTERLAAKNAIDAIDGFMAKVPEKSVVAGDTGAAAKTLQTARGNYAAAMQASNIDKKTIQAELRAAAANSGQNVANTVRQRMADILLKPAELRGYTMAERAQMEKIVRGTVAGNALRFTGNLLGGGGGLGAMTSAAIGGYATGGPGAFAPVVGYALKQLSNRMTLKQAAKLSEMVRSRAPLANAMTDFGAKAQAHEVSPSPQTLAAVTIAARNLSNNLKDAGIMMTPADLIKTLHGPMPAAADQDQ